MPWKVACSAWLYIFDCSDITPVPFHETFKFLLCNYISWNFLLRGPGQEVNFLYLPSSLGAPAKWVHTSLTVSLNILLTEAIDPSTLGSVSQLSREYCLTLISLPKGHRPLRKISSWKIQSVFTDWFLVSWLCTIFCIAVVNWKYRYPTAVIYCMGTRLVVSSGVMCMLHSNISIFHWRY